MTDAERHELAEAEALAQALERDAALPELPADALQTAAFLRFNAKDADLGETAEQRIFAELGDALQRTAQPKPRRTWLWFTPALTLGAGVLGAAAWLFFVQTHSQPQEAALVSEAPRATSAATALQTVSAVPKPSPRLIEGLSERLRRNTREGSDRVPADSELWTRELNQYRSALVQTLDPQHAEATLAAHTLAQAATTVEQRSVAANALSALARSLETIRTPTSTLLAQDAWHELTLIFLNEGRYLEALARALQGIEVSSVPSIFLANMHLAAAEAYERLERYDRAPEEYFQALEVYRQLMQDSLGK
ncbi:MAG TPA: hypothetical protein VHO25_14320 [Polyangiaceae bacterium]|nr:hypothetical protein [Polyangiaceae bacterium]